MCSTLELGAQPETVGEHASRDRGRQLPGQRRREHNRRVVVFFKDNWHKLIPLPILYAAILTAYYWLRRRLGRNESKASKDRFERHDASALASDRALAVVT
jgi:hypothetical protein